MDTPSEIKFSEREPTEHLRGESAKPARCGAPTALSRARVLRTPRLPAVRAHGAGTSSPHKRPQQSHQPQTEGGRLQHVLWGSGVPPDAEGPRGAAVPARQSALNVPRVPRSLPSRLYANDLLLTFSSTQSFGNQPQSGFQQRLYLQFRDAEAVFLRECQPLWGGVQRHVRACGFSGGHGRGGGLLVPTSCPRATSVWKFENRPSRFHRPTRALPRWLQRTTHVFWNMY